MTIQNMHYDFKLKINKLDSQKWRNLKIPQIDWLLREAETMLIKSIAMPRFKNGLGFEINKRNIHDIYTIVVNNEIVPMNILAGTTSYEAVPPDDYWFEVASYVVCTKDTCIDRKIRVFPKQHDDLHEESAFDNSSFEWGEVNCRMFDGGFRVFTDGTFTISDLCLDYIRRPAIMHYADGWGVAGYNLPDGTVLTGTQDSELPEGIHNEIVDLAVVIATSAMMIPDYAVKREKLKLND